MDTDSDGCVTPAKLADWHRQATESFPRLRRPQQQLEQYVYSAPRVACAAIGLHASPTLEILHEEARSWETLTSPLTPDQNFNTIDRRFAQIKERIVIDIALEVQEVAKLVASAEARVAMQMVRWPFFVREDPAFLDAHNLPQLASLKEEEVKEVAERFMRDARRALLPLRSVQQTAGPQLVQSMEAAIRVADQSSSEWAPLSADVQLIEAQIKKDVATMFEGFAMQEENLYETRWAQLRSRMALRINEDVLRVLHELLPIVDDVVKTVDHLAP